MRPLYLLALVSTGGIGAHDTLFSQFLVQWRPPSRSSPREGETLIRQSLNSESLCRRGPLALSCVLPRASSRVIQSQLLSPNFSWGWGTFHAEDGERIVEALLVDCLLCLMAFFNSIFALEPLTFASPLIVEDVLADLDHSRLWFVCGA